MNNYCGYKVIRCPTHKKQELTIKGNSEINECLTNYYYYYSYNLFINHLLNHCLKATYVGSWKPRTKSVAGILW